jgi:hypothetical protein
VFKGERRTPVKVPVRLAAVLDETSEDDFL